jgi:hypothetical protein
LEHPLIVLGPIHDFACAKNGYFLANMLRHLFEDSALEQNARLTRRRGIDFAVTCRKLGRFSEKNGIEKGFAESRLD